MPRLYELNEDFLRLQAMLDESEDEDTKALLEETLESIEGSIEVKVEGLIRLFKNYEAEAEMFKAEKDRLLKKQQTANNKAESVKNFIEYILTDVLGYSGTNKKVLNAGLWNARIQNNSPSLFIHHDTAIPEEYYNTPEPVLDKRALMEDIRNGKKIDGVKLKQTQSIRIR